MFLKLLFLLHVCRHIYFLIISL